MTRALELLRRIEVGVSASRCGCLSPARRCIRCIGLLNAGELRAEIERLQADGERLDWLERAGSNVRVAIDEIRATLRTDPELHESLAIVRAMTALPESAESFEASAALMDARKEEKPWTT